MNPVPANLPAPVSPSQAATVRHPRQQVIQHAEPFRRLLGTNLDRLSFEDRQAVAHGLISQVVVTGAQVG
jgi:hypothetical protein